MAGSGMGNMATAFQSPVTIDFGGETLILEPITLRDWGNVGAYLRQQQRSDILSIANQQAELLDDAAERKEALADARKEARAVPAPELDEVLEWARGLEGLSYVLWYSLEKRYAGKYLPGDVLDILHKMGADAFEALQEATDQAAGAAPGEPSPHAST